MRLARLARRQHNVVALIQLLALCLTASGVRSRVARGRLHRIFRGVYALGSDLLSREGRWMAAVLACGPGAALAYRSAGALRGFRPDNRAVCDVSVPEPECDRGPASSCMRSPP